MATDTWTDRDFPVLDAAVELLEERRGLVTIEDIAERTGIAGDDVVTAVQSLAAAAYVELAGSMVPQLNRIAQVSAEARRLTGAWPTPEIAADRFEDALARLIEAETNDERRSKLVKARDAAAGIGRDVLVRLLSHALTGQIG